MAIFLSGSSFSLSVEMPNFFFSLQTIEFLVISLSFLVVC